MSHRKFRGLTPEGQKPKTKLERFLQKSEYFGLPKKFFRTKRTAGRMAYFKLQLKGRPDAKELWKKYGADIERS